MLGGKALEHDPTQPLVVHSTLGYLGGLEELIVWACSTNPEYEDPRQHPEYGAVEEELQTLADREFAAHIEAATAAGQAFAYLDFGSRALEAAAAGKSLTAGGAPSRPGTSAGTTSAVQSRPATQGGGRTARRGSTDGSSSGGDYGPHRVIVELFARRCPRTVENFLALCTGSAGTAKDPATGKTFPLHYVGSPVHRVVKDGWIQGGDIVSGRGCDSHSALGEATFPDEHLHTGFDAPGLLAMANSGPHTNGSQFMLTLRELPVFNHKYCVFGRVIFGQSVLDSIATDVPVRQNQRPVEPLTLVASDVFTAAMLDEQVNKWTRKRAPPAKKKKAKAATSNGAPRVPESPRLAPKAATLLVLGFSGSGKSTLVNNLLGRPFEFCNPTVGFERSQLTLPPATDGQFHSPFQLQLYGLGGAGNIRGYWANYYDAAHGIVFVVDASVSSEESWAELRSEFHDVTTHPLVAGKPILIFANKQDQPGALSATEVAMRLAQQGGHAASASASAAASGADGSSPSASSNLHVVKCCARTDAARKPLPAASPLSPAGAALNPDAIIAASTGSLSDVDPSVHRGFGWLFGKIEQDYQPLSERVRTDIAEAKRKAKEQMDASRAKIKAAREAREAEEAAAAAAQRGEATAAAE